MLSETPSLPHTERAPDTSDAAPIDFELLGLVDDNPNKLENFVGDYVFNAVPGTKEIALDQPVEVL